MDRTTHSIIIARDISKTVLSGTQPLQILNNVNLNIEPAETVAILGPSGSGKTTLLGLLAGLDTPSSGSIKINNEEITTMDEDGRARIRAQQIGFIFQTFQLIPSMTALENVMLPLELIQKQLPESTARNWLERVGLTKRMHHYPKQLCGGEQQRVAIARAFAVKPKILFADEPTGNLDDKTAANIIDLLFDLNQQNNTNLLVVTHDEHLAKRCQRQLLLKNGTLQ